jgi:hypothetical protein
VSGASNVTGFVQPIHRLARKAHAVGARILVDAAQLAPHRRIDVRPDDDPDLYATPAGAVTLGSVPRLTASGDDIYLKRLSSLGKRALVRVTGEYHLNGRIGWIDEDDIESAGEKCPLVYSPN